MERIKPALMISYCGLKCDECDAYIVTRTNNRLAYDDFTQGRERVEIL